MVEADKEDRTSLSGHWILRRTLRSTVFRRGDYASRDHAMRSLCWPYIRSVISEPMDKCRTLYRSCGVLYLPQATRLGQRSSQLIGLSCRKLYLLPCSAIAYRTLANGRGYDTQSIFSRGI